MERQEDLPEQSGKNNIISPFLNSSKIRGILLVIIAGVIGYYIGVTKIAIDWRNYQPHIEITSKEPPASLATLDFSPLWEVIQKLSDTYYDKNAIHQQDFLNGAINGVIATLDDPYTMYLPKAKNTDFKQGLAGQFEGIGAELGLKGKQIVVVAPLDGSPAQKAGIRAQDEIIKVNSENIANWTLNQVVEKIRGPKGTKVVLTIMHKSQTTPKEIAIVRDTIKVKSVVTWLKKLKDIDGINLKESALKNALDDKVAYIRLSQFGDTTNNEWHDIVVKVSKEIKADKDIKGVILDLRNNPGGYLNDAVYIASEFISDGDAVMQEDRNGDRTGYKVTSKGLLFDVPLVVLINRGSASASEIVAGALRDHKRAILVGETSFGKGTIQQAEDLSDGVGLHITIAKWLTPNGTWVHKKGLTPDVKVDLDVKDQSHDTQLERAIEQLVTQIQ